MRYLLILLCCLATVVGADPQPSAIIAQLKGQALGKSPAGPFKPASLTPMVPGTLLKLPAGSTVDIRYLADGHHEFYTGPVIVGVGTKKGTAVQGAQGTTSQPLPTLSLRPGDLAPVPSPTPKGTNLSLQMGTDGKPQFSWTSDTAGPYMVEVTNPPSTNVWGGETAANSIEYAGPALQQDDTYVWRVSANGKELAAMRFAMPSAKTVQDLGKARLEADANPEPPASHNALLAAAYEQNGLIQDAVATSRKAVEAAPDDPSYMRRLSTMLNQAGEYAEAHKYEEQARFVEDGLAPLMPDEGFYDMYWDYYGY